MKVTIIAYYHINKKNQMSALTVVPFHTLKDAMIDLKENGYSEKIDRNLYQNPKKSGNQALVKTSHVFYSY